ncbi:hypothetical protein D3C81_925970 [compost metagenome]
MDRDEQVGALLAGDLGTFAQRNEVVAGTRQFGAEALHLVDLPLQLARDRQGDVLLVQATRTQGARVFTAVAGIDGDDDVALAAGRNRQLGHRLARRDRHGRRARRRRGRDGGSKVGALVVQIDHQAVAVLLVGRQDEALRRYLGGQVEHQAHVVRRALRRAHRGDRRVGQLQLVQHGSQLGAIDVDDDAIGRAQGEQAVLHRTGQIEHQAGVVRCAPDAHALDLRGGKNLAGTECQQNDETGQQRPQAQPPTHVYSHAPVVRVAHQASPRAPCGSRRSVRPPACGTMVMSRSAFGKMPVPRSAHSIRHSASPSK